MGSGQNPQGSAHGQPLPQVTHVRILDIRGSLGAALILRVLYGYVKSRICFVLQDGENGVSSEDLQWMYIYTRPVLPPTHAPKFHHHYHGPDYPSLLLCSSKEA